MPEELIRASDFLKQPLEFFTDPYFVAESSTFSYRATTLDSNVLKGFASHAEKLISAQRRFRDLLGETASPVHPQLRDITKSTPLNVAVIRGEQTAAGWDLGRIPALRLRDVAEEKLGISILFVDGPKGVSGAACHLDDGDVIVVNRNDSEGRRNFNIGHELFHLLTWDAMPPAAFDSDEPEGGLRKKERCEQLADSYACGLLMPSEIVKERWMQRSGETFSDWLRQHSDELHVSPLALYWRIVNLGLISKDEMPFPQGTTAKYNPATRVPRLYNQLFVKRLQQVLQRGHLSVIRATEILDCSIGDLAKVLKAYELEVPFGY